jgi:hypothetical protein
MTPDFWLGIAVLLGGGTATCLGVYAYVGRGAPAFFERTHRNSFGSFGRATIAFLTPAGVGFALMGVAIIDGKNSITDDMLLIGLGIVLLAWLLFFVHRAALAPRG